MEEESDTGLEVLNDEVYSDTGEGDALDTLTDEGYTEE